MLSLILWRHAKSSWNDTSVADHDRPLNARGRAAAPLMARHLADKGLLPKRILCSSSLRTRETLMALLPHLRGNADIRLERDIYEADARSLFALIRAQPDGKGPLMVVGHNPTMDDLTRALITPAFLTGSEIAAGFPTGAVAVIGFGAESWADVQPETGTLEMFARPRDLEA